MISVQAAFFEFLSRPAGARRRLCAPAANTIDPEGRLPRRRRGGGRQSPTATSSPVRRRPCPTETRRNRRRRVRCPAGSAKGSRSACGPPIRLCNLTSGNFFGVCALCPTGGMPPVGRSVFLVFRVASKQTWRTGNAEHRGYED